VTNKHEEQVAKEILKGSGAAVFAEIRGPFISVLFRLISQSKSFGRI
jgi:hypothetical protein